MKQDLKARHHAVVFTRPKLRISADGLVVIVEARAVAIGVQWGAAVEVPLGWGALRLSFAFRRVLQRLG